MNLSPELILSIVVAYFIVLMVVSWFTGKQADNADFFIAGRKSPWLLVAIGMIGASLSGVTFISIPGKVGAGGLNQAFSYMQVVFGYLLGYVVIAQVLLPLYYRLNLTSIYEYLEQRFGVFSYKTGAAYFLLSRIIGASFRLFLVAIVLQKFVMEPFGMPFWSTVVITILLIWVYTFKGGIKTIVWTDTLQTICMLTAVVLTIFAIGNALDEDLGELISMVQNSKYSQVFFFEGGWEDPNNFFKQFFAGALITIVMTGLDQDMMQKNLSCKSLKDAQKNMYTFSGILVFANILFLTLGALLYLYANEVGLELPTKLVNGELKLDSDLVYPTIGLGNLGAVAAVVFILGLVAAAYSSADSALTALTTSFCIDFLDFGKSDKSENEKQKTRWMVHLGFSIVLLGTILLFHALNSDAVINELFKVAGYTYGPILGLFVFGMFTKRKLRDNLVIPVCLAAPVLSYLINYNSKVWFNGFEFGFLIIALNGLVTFFGLWAISYEGEEVAES